MKKLLIIIISSLLIIGCTPREPRSWLVPAGRNFDQDKFECAERASKTDYMLELFEMCMQGRGYIDSKDISKQKKFTPPTDNKWILYGTARDGTKFFHHVEASISPGSEGFETWTFIINNESYTTKFIKEPIFSSKDLISFNCDKRSYKTKVVLFYGNKEGKGAPISQMPGSGKWELANERHVLRPVIEHFCAGIPAK